MPNEPERATDLIHVRATPQMVAALDKFAAYVGMGRSEYVRAALDLANAVVALGACDIAEASPRVDRQRASAQSDMAGVIARLSPTPPPVPLEEPDEGVSVERRAEMVLAAIDAKGVVVLDPARMPAEWSSEQRGRAMDEALAVCDVAPIDASEREDGALLLTRRGTSN